MKIVRTNKTNGMGKIKAFFDLETEEGFTIKGFKIIEGINGFFVSFPSRKGKDNEYNDTVFASKELRQKLNHLALEHYENPDQAPDYTKETDNQDEGLPF